MSEDPIDLEAGTTELLAECFVASGGLQGLDASPPRGISIFSLVLEVMRDAIERIESEPDAGGTQLDLADDAMRTRIAEKLAVAVEWLLDGICTVPTREALMAMAICELGTRAN